MRWSLQDAIKQYAPYESRQEMVHAVGHWIGVAKIVNGQQIRPKRHSIMDAFRRLKQAGVVEEWCDGTITLTGEVPTRK